MQILFRNRFVLFSHEIRSYYFADVGRVYARSFTRRYALQQPRHILAEVYHCLLAFFVLPDIGRRRAVYHIPIRGGHDGHLID